MRRLRLERAAGELRWTDRPVIDIALDAGYDAPEPFTRAFRGHFGEPPSRFRARTGSARRFPPAACRVHFGIDDAVARFAAPTGAIHHDRRTHRNPALTPLSRHGASRQLPRPSAKRSPASARSPTARGLAVPGAPSIGIYYDDPDTVPTAQLRSHACMAVRDGVTSAPEGCELITLEGGDVAVATHRGPYARLPESYRELFSEWLPSSGREAAHRPCHEAYLNDASTTPEADLLTEICLPLVPAAARRWGRSEDPPPTEGAGFSPRLTKPPGLEASAAPRSPSRAEPRRPDTLVILDAIRGGGLVTKRLSSLATPGGGCPAAASAVVAGAAEGADGALRPGGAHRSRQPAAAEAADGVRHRRGTADPRDRVRHRALSFRGALALLPDGAMLVTERPGACASCATACSIPSRLPARPRRETSVSRAEPGAVHGYMDVALHPNFAENRFVYLATPSPSTRSARPTAIARGRWDGLALDRHEGHLRRRRWNGANASRSGETACST